MNAVEREFISTKDTKSEKILCYIPVTKKWISFFILALIMNCRSSFRGAIRSLKELIGFEISCGSVHNICMAAIENAKEINSKEDLSLIKTGANDELFHCNKPILTGIDTKSYYCYLLNEEDRRDADTWALTLWEAVDKGLNLDYAITDGGKGIVEGHNIGLPNTEILGDIFHAIKDLKDLKRFLGNKSKSSRREYDKILKKIEREKTKKNGTPQKYTVKVFVCKKNKDLFDELYHDVGLLVSWLEMDVFQKAGLNLKDREMLFDFIVNEFDRLENIYPHRIREVRVMLQNNKARLFSFVSLIDQRFDIISEKYRVSKKILWAICNLQKYSKQSQKYYEKYSAIYPELKGKFTEIEEVVIGIMNDIDRTSSAVENLNGRLKNYFFLRQNISSGYLDLLRFFLNHSEFMASEHPLRKGKSPVDILTGKNNPPWYVV